MFNKLHKYLIAEILKFRIYTFLLSINIDIIYNLHINITIYISIFMWASKYIIIYIYNEICVYLKIFRCI